MNFVTLKRQATWYELILSDYLSVVDTSRFELTLSWLGHCAGAQQAAVGDGICTDTLHIGFLKKPMIGNLVYNLPEPSGWNLKKIEIPALHLTRTLANIFEWESHGRLWRVDNPPVNTLDCWSAMVKTDHHASHDHDRSDSIIMMMFWADSLSDSVTCQWPGGGGAMTTPTPNANLRYRKALD